MINKTIIKARSENIAIQEVPGELLIFDTLTRKAYCLNETAAFIWKNCDGKNSISDISALLGRELNSPINDDLVWLAIDQLGKDNLLENKVKESTTLGLSRRDVLKRIGVASMVALPVVASLVYPSKALAVACGNACTVAIPNSPQCMPATTPGCTRCSPSLICVPE